MSENKRKTNAMTTKEKPKVIRESDKNDRSPSIWNLNFHSVNIFQKPGLYLTANNVPIGTIVPKGTERHYHPAFCGTF